MLAESDGGGKVSHVMVMASLDCSLEEVAFEVANPWIFSPQTQFEVARLPQKWEYPMGALCRRHI